MNLFTHQKEGVEFLKKRAGAILGDEMGLGKTRQAIVALGRVSDHLNVIVCPASLKLNWEREIKMVYPEDEVYVDGDIIGFLESNAAWLVVNYDQLKKWGGVLIEKKYCLVGDEAHYIKGRSLRSRLFLKLADEAERVYLLTGTPILNRPIELYNLLKAIKHPITKTKRTGKDNWWGFALRYCGAHRITLGNTGKSFLDIRGATHLDELKEKISDSFLRRTKDKVLDLPPKIEQMILIELSKDWQKKYDSAFDDYIKFLRDNPIEGKIIDNVILARHLVEIQKLKQVCSEAKIDAIKEDVESMLDASESVVIFTQYRQTLKTLVSAFPGSVSIDGSDSMESRQEAVDLFQSGASRVFIGNIKAAGIGITLTRSSNVVFADLDWTPAVHDQAADRCHRIGQTGTVNVRYYVTRGTIEEDIMEMLDKKRKIIEKVLAGDDSKSETMGVKELVGRISARVDK